MKNGLINVGVVGCGYWGRKHVRVFSELPDSRVAAVCDMDKALAREASKPYHPALVTNDFEKLLDSDVDAVVVATPPQSHYRLALQALMEGKHVLVEKPFTTSEAEARHLIQVAQEKELMLMVGHTFLYNPAVNYLKELIGRGRLGEPFYIYSSRLNFGIIQRDINVIWDLAPHDLSIVLYLLDRSPVSLAVQGAAGLSLDQCPVAHLDLRFSGDVHAHIHVSWLHPFKVRQLTIIGSQGMAVYDDMDAESPIRIYDRKVKCSGKNGGPRAPSLTYEYGDIQLPHIPGAEPLRREGAHFLTCIREGATPMSDPWSGLRVVSILEAAEKMLCSRSLYGGGDSLAGGNGASANVLELEPEPARHAP